MTKKPRVAWTPDLHARFVKAVTALGVDTAVPKQIMLVRVRLPAWQRCFVATTPATGHSIFALASRPMDLACWGFMSL